VVVGRGGRDRRLRVRLPVPPPIEKRRAHCTCHSAWRAGRAGDLGPSPSRRKRERANCRKRRTIWNSGNSGRENRSGSFTPFATIATRAPAARSTAPIGITSHSVSVRWAAKGRLHVLKVQRRRGLEGPRAFRKYDRKHLTGATAPLPMSDQHGSTCGASGFRYASLVVDPDFS
jgi:hypothetical protein